MKFDDMKRVKRTCLQCLGTGKIFLRPQKIKTETAPYVTCDMCEGSGKHVGNLLWEAQGILLKDWRLEECLTLRGAAKKFKIDPSNLSKMERGIIKPESTYLKMVTES